MVIRTRTETSSQTKPQADNTADSIFQDANYMFLQGQSAGKQAREFPETKHQAISQARAEFNRRKLVKHESAFIEGFVSTVRGGFFASEQI